jgi:tetratricopeptide (TPR) repeat protein
MQYLKSLITILVILNFPLTFSATPCDQANTLVKQVYALGNQPAQQKRLLQRALNLCPNFVPAHQNLGVIYENEHNDSKALHHYRQALKQHSNYYPAWVGIGDVYYKQNQLPLSLEAYLHACTRHPRARQRTSELLHENRYRTAESGEVIKHESLELLYDQARLQKLYQLATQCRRQYKSVASAADTKAFLVSVVVFRNINFKSGSAQIKLEQRANAIKKALAQRGIAEINMKARGYGSSKPIEQGHSETAWAKNRRVEIKLAPERIRRRSSMKP